MWRASRFGVTGDLLHPLTHRPTAAPEVMGALLEHVGAALVANDDLERIQEQWRVVRTRGTGSETQKRALRETGEMGRAVVRLAQLSCPE